MVTDNATAYLRDATQGNVTYAGVISGNGLFIDEYNTASTPMPDHLYSANNTMTGSVQFNGGGNIWLGVTTASAFSAATSLTFNRGEAFTIQDQTQNSNRIGDSTKVVFNGVYSTWVGSSTAATNETIGELH